MLDKIYIGEILDAEDGSGDGILQFPEEFLKEQDWREDDRIDMNIVNGKLIIRNLDWIDRESLSRQTQRALD